MGETNINGSNASGRVLPILFNAEMVRAILSGRKKCTRRLVKFLPGENPRWTGYVKDGLMLYNGRNEPCIRKAPYQSGDILYVRETWGEGYREGTYIYKADSKLGDLPTFKKTSKMLYHPSIHMPKEAARIWLRVVDVKLEQLQDITEIEAICEGAIDNRCFIHSPNNEYVHIHTAREHFEEIWNSTIKRTDLKLYGWDANPLVWVIDFEICGKPAE